MGIPPYIVEQGNVIYSNDQIKIIFKKGTIDKLFSGYMTYPRFVSHKAHLDSSYI